MSLLFGLFIILLVVGTPISLALFSSSIVYMVINGLPLEMAAARMAAGPNSFPLLAISFFILAGQIMNKAGVTEKIFDFADHLVGHYTGGLGHANVMASIIFSGMSGSAAADVGGLGAIELKAMKDAGYDEDFSLAVTGASSIVGPIIPPSVPAVVFGVASGVSIGRLFIAGVIPGLLLGGVVSLLLFIQSKKRHYPKRVKATMKEIFISFRRAFFALLTPVIIIGGIMVGVFTPTEAAIAAVVYALILGFSYKTITIKDIPDFLINTLKTTIGILFIISTATLFAWLLTVSQFPQTFSATFLSIIDNKVVGLLVINLLLLVVGCFMETTPAQMVLVPILLPIAVALGVDPVHFGIIMIINLMIGLMTPPLGLVLFVLSSVSNVSIEKLSIAILPYVLVILAALIVITFVPEIALFLPNLVFNG
ncbi:MAG: TRAP transporter large permease [Sphaerochaetaceae bacterium]|nr:TRAP transporter large permease [Sphaerochaetaceae bacterium]